MNPISRYRFLIIAISFSIAVHAVSLLAMVLLLGPGLDTQVSVLERAHYVAENPWLWRIGWLPWQITAASDLLVSVAIVRYIAQTPNRYGRWASWGALLGTLIAIIPDQWGELLFVREHISLAQEVVAGSDTAVYLKAEARGLLQTGTCGGTGYVLMSIGWLFSAVQSAGGLKRHRAFVFLAVVCLSLFSIAASANWYATSHASGGYPLFTVVFIANALAFPLLLLWMTWLGAVFGDGHHRRHASPDAAVHAMVSPARGWREKLVKICSAPGLRDVVRCLVPTPILVSDISDVVYLNWRVPEARVQQYLPAPLSAHVVDGHTWVSVLSYRHGHLGPRVLGPLRRLFSSPYQSNWRFYLASKEGEPVDAIYFVKTMMSDPLYAPFSRVFSDGLPAHLSETFEHSRDGDSYITEIVAGRGSAAALTAEVRVDGKLKDEYREIARYLVEQNRAVYVNAGLGRIGESRISIPIDLDSILSAELSNFQSAFLAPIIGDAECIAFVIPKVKFSALGERWTARTLE